MELLQNFVQCLLVYYEKKTLSTKNGVASKFCANVYMCSVKKKTFYQKWSCFKILCKLLLVQYKKITFYQKWSCFKILCKLLLMQYQKIIFYQNWSCFISLCKCLHVQYKKKLSTKNGVVTKFCANVYMCSIRKNFLPKMELLQIFVQT